MCDKENLTPGEHSVVTGGRVYGPQFQAHYINLNIIYNMLNTFKVKFD